VFKRSCQKLTLDKLVLQSIKQSTTSEKEPHIDKQEVVRMLKIGAYAVFSDEADQRMKSFHEADITSILERSEVRKYEATTEDEDSSFSTATFIPADSDQALRIDDPNFFGLADAMAAGLSLEIVL